jgi:DNA-binding response OmpR family regulator
VDDLPSPPIPQARILIVEDETMTRKAIARALGLLGYDVEEAASGQQALSKLSTSAYDLMLLDLRMPGMDGMQVMKQVQESHPDLMVIVLTAHATLDSAITAVRTGAVDYLLKPSSIGEIKTAISRALEPRHERLRRKHLIRVMSEALEALQAEEKREAAVASKRADRFLQRGGVTLDREKRLVAVAGAADAPGVDSTLTMNEAALLAHLMLNPDHVSSCRELARDALGYDVTEKEAQDIVRPHISRLRKKIEPDPAHPRLIRTVRGRGYLFTSN